jgi:hypothetical protein
MAMTNPMNLKLMNQRKGWSFHTPHLPHEKKATLIQETPHVHKGISVVVADISRYLSKDTNEFHMFNDFDRFFLTRVTISTCFGCISIDSPLTMVH